MKVDKLRDVLKTMNIYIQTLSNELSEKPDHFALLLSATHHIGAMRALEEMQDLVRDAPTPQNLSDVTHYMAIRTDELMQEILDGLIDGKVWPETKRSEAKNSTD